MWLPPRLRPPDPAPRRPERIGLINKLYARRKRVAAGTPRTEPMPSLHHDRHCFALPPPPLRLRDCRLREGVSQE